MLVFPNKSLGVYATKAENRLTEYLPRLHPGNPNRFPPTPTRQGTVSCTLVLGANKIKERCSVPMVHKLIR